jgi:hypothetical protein
MCLQDKNTISFNMSLYLKEDLAREGDKMPDSTKKDASQWQRVRTTSGSPFLTVRHQVLVELIIQYQHETSDDGTIPIAQEVLRFSVPLHFVIPSMPFTSLPSQSSTSLVSSSSSQENNRRVPYGKHALMKIPAYSQLFYPNGEPRCNDWESQGEPLPLYCKAENISFSESE